MTTPPTNPSIPLRRRTFTAPVIDYEPPASLPAGQTCPPPTPAALHRRTPQPLRRAPRPRVMEAAPPPAAVAFAEAALRRVLEVIDRRRPIAQLKPLLAYPLIDTVAAHANLRMPATATLRRVGLRLTDTAGTAPPAAEVFATYTRGRRVRVIAARIEQDNTNRWRVVALQIG